MIKIDGQRPRERLRWPGTSGAVKGEVGSSDAVKTGLQESGHDGGQNHAHAKDKHGSPRKWDLV